MSTAKRPGSRDISDLKARLGLKKKAPTGAQAAVPPPSGVIPPPHRQTGSIPVPPGVTPPASAYAPAPPVQQHVPNAADDPFGAMNAMAANQAAVATAAPPPIVVVNDGMPVARVDRPGGLARYGKIVAMLIAPLILGMIVGQIGNSAKNYNRTISDSKKIRIDVEAVGKQLLGIQALLQVAQERGPKNAEGKPWYKNNDEKLTKELGEVPKLTYDSDVVYKSFVYDLPPEISEQIFLYYTQIGNLRKMLQEHLKKSPKNAEAIAAGQKKLGAYVAKNLAALVSAPTPEQARQGRTLQVRIVQLGLPVCEPKGKPSSEGCKAAPAGAQYRVSETGNYGVKEFVGPVTSAQDGKLVFIDPSTPFFKGLVQGGVATVAEAAYMERITEIHNQVEDLVQVRKFILDVLNNKANESEKFTFFM